MKSWQQQPRKRLSAEVNDRERSMEAHRAINMAKMSFKILAENNLCLSYNNETTSKQT